jgi:hypothetical protein
MTTAERIEDLAAHAPTGDAWTTTGEVRGGCGHRHRTATGVARCLVRDERGCAAQGAYSDRRIVEVTHG